MDGSGPHACTRLYCEWHERVLTFSRSLGAHRLYTVDEVLAGERRAGLMAAVNALPERERQVLVCRYFLDLSEAETAQVLEWPLGSVKSRTFRALNRLRGLLVAGQQGGVSRG